MLLSDDSSSYRPIWVQPIVSQSTLELWCPKLESRETSLEQISYRNTGALAFQRSRERNVPAVREFRSWLPATVVPAYRGLILFV
jgi:hypothetical protein